MKIVIFDVEPWEREAFVRSDLRSLEEGNELILVEEALGEDNVAGYADAEAVSVFTYSNLSRHVLEQLPHLRFIATRSTGFDHIDLECCRERGIAVANVPTYGENTVAEHVFALLLAISHRLVDAVDNTRRGYFSEQGLRGFDLNGKTIAVIGTGNIGRNVIRIAKGFQMNVVAFDLKPDTAVAERLGFEYLGFDETLAAADIITLHVPGGERTRDLISEREFDLMKPGVVLINTARGNIVSVRALLRAIAEGKVKAAGLDVLPEEAAVREEAELLRSVYARSRDLEALLADHILLRMRNVLITPHSAFNTREAVQRILDTSVENIKAFVRGEPKNLVQAVTAG